MNAHPQFNPIIVGGMGGSGTRVVAKILEASGVYMGNYLNTKHDNMLFFLFGSPERFRWTYTQFRPYFILFEKLHLGNKLTLYEKLLFLRQGFTLLRQKELYKHVSYAFKNRTKAHVTDLWGWKNGPNQFLLPQLHQHYPNCFYIHTLRNGLDMAFSSNTRQLRYWGSGFGLRVKEDIPVPVQQLEFWIRSNAFVLEYCRTHLPHQHYVLRFDELCRYPEKVIGELHKALDISSAQRPDQLASLVQSPDSIDRYKYNDNSLFSQYQLKAVKQMGFNIEET